MSATKSAKHISFRMFGLDEYLSMLFSCFISSELGSIFCNIVVWFGDEYSVWNFGSVDEFNSDRRLSDW